MPARKRTKRIPGAKQEISASTPRESQHDLVPPFKQELRAWSEGTGTDALVTFKALVDANCSDKRLMYCLMALRRAREFEAQVHGEASRMDSRRLRSLVERTCSVASEWGQEFQSPFGKMVLERAARSDVFCKEVHYRNVPQMLRSLAAEAKTIHRGSSRERRPLYNDNLAALMEYVKLKTGHYHDPEVSALVWFATGGECDANTLGVWRNEHPGPLKRARLRLATP